MSIIQPLKAKHELGPELEVDVLDVADGQDLEADDDLQLFIEGHHRGVVDPILKKLGVVLFLKHLFVISYIT